MKATEGILSINYDHLARVIAAKHRRKLSGQLDVVRIGISSTTTYPRTGISFDLGEALKNCTLLRQK